jgi:prepilin-type N-terminal cleavage/methylation domain-containing protein/prepilin-type processing-associated H-X9-DG protein
MPHPAHPRRRPSAFTLIELLTVIAIIGILAAIIIPTVSKVRQTAKNAQCTAQLREWGRVITLYANDNKGNYYAKNWASIAEDDAPMKRSYHPYFSSAKSKQEGYRMRYCPADPKTDEILASTTPNSEPRYLITVGAINGTLATVPTEDKTKPAALPLSKAATPSQFILMVESVVPAGTGGATSTGFTIRGSDTATMQSYIQPLGDGTAAYLSRHGGSKFNAVFGDGSVKRVGWSTNPNDKNSVFSMRGVWFQLY